MRIVSLLPSATEIVFALGLGDELVGRTHECDYPPEAAVIPIVTSDVGATATASSREINARVAASIHGGSSIYRLDLEALAAADADLVLTQELCRVCAVSYREVADAVRRLETDTSIVSLEPTSIEGIFNTISTVGAMAEAEDEAVGLIELLRDRLAHIENRVLERRLEGVPARRVVCLEWLDPPFASGHWVPEQVRRAGGWDLLGRIGEPAVETTWEQVLESEPELVVIAACGFDADEAAERSAGLRLPCRAVAVDADGFYSRPAPRLADGVQQLGNLLHPDVVPDPGLPAIELQLASPQAQVIGEPDQVSSRV